MIKIRCIWHWIAGAGSPFGFFLHPIVPALCLIAFLAYQIKQDLDLAKSKKKNPDSHLDILEFITPFIVVLITLGILKFVGIL